jgi:hypothetical protein
VNTSSMFAMIDRNPKGVVRKCQSLV